ncbi:MAG: hypothetical protein ACI9EW_000393 [Cellvibrionaceae bacterium]|jgi:uncharacterized protein (DUF1697 family)
MAKYISMLRGINVSGHKKIKMVELRDHYTDLGFENVTSYIQSGNLFFDSQIHDIPTLVSMLETMIYEKYRFEVPVIIRTADDLEKVIAINPLAHVPEEKFNVYIVTFLAETPTADATAQVPATGRAGEETVIIGREVYTYYANGSGRSKMTTNYFEKKLGVAATARNWRSVLKLHQLAQ